MLGKSRVFLNADCRKSRISMVCLQLPTIRTNRVLKWSLNIESFRRLATLFKSQTFVFSNNGYVFYQIYWPADTMIVRLIL